MRKITAISVILFFCLTGLSLAEEIKWTSLTKLGTAPLYRNLDSPERAKEILLKYKEAVKRAIADDFIYQALYARIEGATIKKGQIYPGQEILWMLYAGKKIEEVRMLRYVKWSGNETIDVYTVFIPYEVIDRNDMYECYAEFILPKPCGNISLLKTGCTLIEPEPEPEPEQIRPKLKPEPQPPSREPRQIPYQPPVKTPSTYPSRITPKKDNLRFKVLYPLEPKLSFELPADFQISNKLEDYFGDWDCYIIDGNWIHLWTGTELEYYQGDIVSLYEKREIAQVQLGFPFGFEAEIRLAGNIWIGGGYSQSGIANIKTSEEADFVEFEEFEEKDTGQYEMKFNRFSLVQEIDEKFYFRNAQAYLKAEFSGYELTKWFIGAGVDFLQVNQETEKKEESYELTLWTGKVLNEEIESSHSKQGEWITRPFVLAGVGIDVAKGLQLGAEGRVFFESKQFEYEKSSIFIVEGESDSWLIKTPFYSLRVFLAYSF